LEVFELARGHGFSFLLHLQYIIFSKGRATAFTLFYLKTNLLEVGETKDGVLLVEADILTQTAPLKKGETAITLKVGE